MNHKITLIISSIPANLMCVTIQNSCSLPGSQILDKISKNITSWIYCSSETISIHPHRFCFFCSNLTYLSHGKRSYARWYKSPPAHFKFINFLACRQLEANERVFKQTILRRKEGLLPPDSRNFCSISPSRHREHTFYDILWYLLTISVPFMENTHILLSQCGLYKRLW